jgi:hypothetical protein
MGCLGDLGVSGRKIRISLKELEYKDVDCTEPMAVFCEHGNKPWGSTKGEEFVKQLRHY